MADNMQNTAAMIGQASTVKKYNDIPIDVLPDSSFGRLYAPGTKTLGGKSLDENTRQYDLDLQESKRASLVKEALAQKEYEEMVRANKADEAYKWAALNRSGSTGSNTKAPTATELLDSIRRGAVDFAQRTMQVTPYNAESPYNAVQATKQLLNSEAAKMPITLSAQQYDDIVKAVSQAVGYEIPDEKASTDEAANLRSMLGL